MPSASFSSSRSYVRRSRRKGNRIPLPSRTSALCEPPCQNIPAPNVGSSPSGQQNNGPALSATSGSGSSTANPASSSSSSSSTASSSSSSSSNLNLSNSSTSTSTASSSSSSSTATSGSGSSSVAAGTSASSSSSLPSSVSSNAIITSVAAALSEVKQNSNSPYDLRKKSPLAAHDSGSWLAGSSSSGGSSAGGSSSSSSGSAAAAAAAANGNGLLQFPSLAYDGNAAYMLPARKRPRRTYSTSTETSAMAASAATATITSATGATGSAAMPSSAATTFCIQSAAHYLQYEMPDEVLLTIFSYLLEQDLCRVSLVCKRFQTIANDTELWKRMYQSVYEYDLPLFNPEPCSFAFVKLEDSDYANPWKESFRQLYRGIHVRPGYQDRRYQGRSIAYFNTVQAALDYIDEKNPAGTGAATGSNSSNNSSNSNSSSSSNSNANNSSTSNSPGAGANGGSAVVDEAFTTLENTGALIFLHQGTYRGEFLVIDSDVALIGAASGNVAESVILERESESTVMFVEGAKHAYVGHMTLKFSPDVTSTVPHHKHYCLEVSENCSPTVDHCIIRSTSV
ncbi:hypothetical protein pipiens_018793, partial [Culex pipiens pipiens]